MKRAVYAPRSFLAKPGRFGSRHRTVSLDQLLALPGIWRGAALAATTLPGVPTGFAKLDRELPGAGWPVGALTEVLSDHVGIGELTLLMPALAALTRAGRWVALVAPPHLPYAPALAQAGVALERVLVVRPGAADIGWALEQTLRAGACAAVLGWPALAGTHQPNSALKYPQLRRLQLVAERSVAMAFLFRSQAAGREASPAALRLELAPTMAGGLLVDIIKRRGLAAGAPIMLDVHRQKDRRRFTALAARRIPTGEFIN